MLQGRFGEKHTNLGIKFLWTTQQRKKLEGKNEKIGNKIQKLIQHIGYSASSRKIFSQLKPHDKDESSSATAQITQISL